MKTWKQTMTTRERIRAVVRREPADHLPLCFTAICHGIIGFLNERRLDKIKQAEFLMNLGVDAGISITPPNHSLKGIEIKSWREEPPDQRYPVLHKEYRTPRGTLRQVVRKTEDYPSSIQLISRPQCAGFPLHGLPRGVSGEPRGTGIPPAHAGRGRTAGIPRRRQSLQGVLRCARHLSLRLFAGSGRSLDLVVRGGAQCNGAPWTIPGSWNAMSLSSPSGTARGWP